MTTDQPPLIDPQLWAAAVDPAHAPEVEDDPLTLGDVIDVLREARQLVDSVVDVVPDLRHAFAPSEPVAVHLRCLEDHARGAWASLTMALSYADQLREKGTR